MRKPNDTLRVVTTALGTSQVIYFRFTDQGLEDNNGNVLLSPERYAAIIQQQQIEKQRAEEMKANSMRETKTISTFTLKPEVENTGPDQLILTDTSLKLHYPGKSTIEVIYFTNIKDIWGVGKYSDYNYYVDTVEYSLLGESDVDHFHSLAKLQLDSKVELQSVHDAIVNAYKVWKGKFPQAVSGDWEQFKKLD